MVNVPDGRTLMATRDSVPYFSATAADRVVSTPIEATTLATAGAERSGRETTHLDHGADRRGDGQGDDHLDHRRAGGRR